MHASLSYETVPPAPPSQRELDAYRQQADRFIAELDEEYYLHYAGLKETFELAPIYERHADLTRVEKAQSLGAAVNGGGGIRELWRFACEGYLGNLTREHAERAAMLEAELQVTIDGDTIPYRMIRPAMANEPDRGRRQELDRVRTDIVAERLNPIHLEAVQVEQGGVKELGSPTYLDLYGRFGFRLDELADQCRAFLASTERLYEETADRLFRARVGVGLSEIKRWDVARVFRATSWDSAFPADKMLPALEATLADLGIRLREQENVHLDLEERPNKTPRAFCAPIEVPGKVMLVIQPIGGPDDWRALFHEAGHTEHFANTSADLEVEERRLGDNAVTEGWAMLLQHLTDDPAWLTRRLDFPKPGEFAAEGATGLLYFVRRYCAKLLYEIEFHGTEDVTTMAPRYVELLGDALKVEPSPADYLSDIDSGFYVTAYLRSWAFEAQLRAFLREKFGNVWFADRSAGSLLRELWGEGQRLTADELLHEVTGAEVEMESVADRIRESLRAA
jgi:hypothetical protein